jgi:hypothetical protein
MIECITEILDGEDLSATDVAIDGEECSVVDFVIGTAWITAFVGAMASIVYINAYNSGESLSVTDIAIGTVLIVVVTGVVAWIGEHWRPSK